MREYEENMDNRKPANPFDGPPLNLPEPTEAYLLGQQRAERGLAPEPGWATNHEYKLGYESGVEALRLGIVKTLETTR